MKVSKNLIITDTKPGNEWDFDKVLSKLTGERWTTVHGGLQYKLLKRKERIKRYINFFRFPLEIFIQRKKIKNLIAWQQYYGLVYALYCMIFHVKKCNYCMVMTFIYNERKGIFGAFQYAIVKKIVNSIYLDCIIVYSKYEKEYYERLFQVSAGKIFYCRLGLEDLTKGIPKAKQEGYILSAGRSNRDYAFLFNTLKGEKYKLKVVCDCIEEETEDNITVYKNTYYEDFFKLLANCFCVVITLKNSNISSGQLVILQAKQFGKPVIITESLAITDYIVDGVDGFIIKKQKKELLNKIQLLLDDHQLYKRMCHASRKSYEDKFSMNALGKQIVKYLKETGGKEHER